MKRNPILEELYSARDQIIASNKGDLRSYVIDARARVYSSGRRISSKGLPSRVADVNSKANDKNINLGGKT